MYLNKKHHVISIYNRAKAILFLLTLINFSSFAQSTSITSTSLKNNIEIKVGYFGNIVFDNGLNVGAEYLLREKVKIKSKGNSQKSITHQFLFNGSLGYSTNFTIDTDNAFYTHYGMIWRRTGLKRWQFHIELNPLGLHRSILPDTYEVKGATVSKVSNPARSYYAPSFAIGIGKLRKSYRRTGWYINLNISFLTAYNAGTYPHISFHYGQRFSLAKKNKQT